MDGAGLKFHEVQVRGAKQESKDIEATSTRAHRFRVDCQEVGIQEPKLRGHDQVSKPVSCYPILKV